MPVTLDFFPEPRRHGAEAGVRLGISKVFQPLDGQQGIFAQFRSKIFP